MRHDVLADNLRSFLKDDRLVDTIVKLNHPVRAKLEWFAKKNGYKNFYTFCNESGLNYSTVYTCFCVKVTAKRPILTKIQEVTNGFVKVKDWPLSKETRGNKKGRRKPEKKKRRFNRDSLNIHSSNASLIDKLTHFAKGCGYSGLNGFLKAHSIVPVTWYHFCANYKKGCHVKSQILGKIEAATNGLIKVEDWGLISEAERAELKDLDKKCAKLKKESPIFEAFQKAIAKMEKLAKCTKSTPRELNEAILEAEEYKNKLELTSLEDIKYSRKINRAKGVHKIKVDVFTKEYLKNN